MPTFCSKFQKYNFFLLVLQSLLQKVELLRRKLRGYQKSLKELQEKANSLIDGGHANNSEIKELLVSLEDAWLECDFSAEARCKVINTVHASKNIRIVIVSDWNLRVDFDLKCLICLNLSHTNCYVNRHFLPLLD